MLVGGLTQNRGGLETFTMGAFRALKHDFEFSFLGYQGVPMAFDSEILAEGGEIVRVTPRSVNPVRYLRDLQRLLKSRRYSVVWLNRLSLGSPELLMMARLNGVPVRIVHSHTAGNMGQARDAVLHQMVKPVVGTFANRKFACSDGAARWFYGECDYTFVPQTLDVERFTYSETVRDTVRRELGLDDDAVVLIHVARFGFVKNHPFTVDILTEMVEAGINIHIVYIGDGHAAPATEALVKERGLADRAHFLGYRADVERYLNAADVSILPSVFEGLPYSALEAQAAQLPTLMSSGTSREAAVTEFAQFIPVDQGPMPWASAISDSLGTLHRVEGANPLRGTMFDSRNARATLLDAIRLPPP